MHQPGVDVLERQSLCKAENQAELVLPGIAFGLRGGDPIGQRPTRGAAFTFVVIFDPTAESPPTSRLWKACPRRQCDLDPLAKCGDVIDLHAGHSPELLAETIVKRSAQTKYKDFFPFYGRLE